MKTASPFSESLCLTRGCDEQSSVLILILHRWCSVLQASSRWEIAWPGPGVVRMFWCISVLALIGFSLQLEGRRLIYAYGNKDPNEEGFRHHTYFLPMSLWNSIPPAAWWCSSFLPQIIFPGNAFCSPPLIFSVAQCCLESSPFISKSLIFLPWVSSPVHLLRACVSPECLPKALSLFLSSCKPVKTRIAPVWFWFCLDFAK